MDWGETAINGLVSIVAAFGGAYFAFRIERGAKQSERSEEEVGWGNQALYTLKRIWSKQEQYRLNVIEAVRTSPILWYSLPVASPSIGSTLDFHPRELAFVLSSNVMAFSVVMIEGDRVQEVARMIHERNNLMLENVHPRLSAAGFQHNDKVTEAQLRQVIGAANVEHLKALTTGIVTQVDLNIKSSKTAFETLLTELKVLHGTAKFIPFEKASGRT